MVLRKKSPSFVIPSISLQGKSQSSGDWGAFIYSAAPWSSPLTISRKHVKFLNSIHIINLGWRLSNFSEHWNHRSLLNQISGLHPQSDLIDLGGVLIYILMCQWPWSGGVISLGGSRFCSVSKVLNGVYISSFLHTYIFN